MSKVLHIQQTVAAPASSVFRALTDSTALTTWFAEHAAVSLDDNRYDFWGRFTPEAPQRAQGGHDIELVESNRRLRYTWHLRGADTTVELRLAERDGTTIVGLWHYGIPHIAHGEPDCYAMDDLWTLWLENLRRYVEGRPATRCDFSASMTGNLTQTVEIDGPAASVWDALVNPKQLNRWIACNATVEPAVGGLWMDWGKEGALEVLEITPGKKLSLGWQIDGSPTVVTWTIEESGGKTRLTLAHSGFAPDRRSDGEWGGWLNYLTLIKSLVEYGADWLPPVKELTRDIALYYAAVTWAQQEKLLGEADEQWE